MAVKNPNGVIHSREEPTKIDHKGHSMVIHKEHHHDPKNKIAPANHLHVTNVAMDTKSKGYPVDATVGWAKSNIGSNGVAAHYRKPGQLLGGKETHIGTFSSHEQAVHAILTKHEEHAEEHHAEINDYLSKNKSEETVMRYADFISEEIKNKDK